MYLPCSVRDSLALGSFAVDRVKYGERTDALVVPAILPANEWARDMHPLTRQQYVQVSVTSVYVVTVYTCHL